MGIITDNCALLALGK
jgi:hypothetical protein